MRSPILVQRIERRVARALMDLPPALIRRLAGRPTVLDGRTLDPQVQLLLLMQRIAGLPPVHARTPRQARADFERNTRIFPVRVPALASVENTAVQGPAGSIPVRVYRPFGVASPAPALVYFHGGGWVIGSLDSHDACCRAIAARASCVVIAVDYRLAPEHRFPAAVEDAVAAFRAIAGEPARFGLDPSRLAVGGDSAGGNLSAVVCQETRGDAVRPCLQALLYPGVELGSARPSVKLFADGFVLSKADMSWFAGHYMAEADRRDPRASPLHGDLRDLPPALVLTAGFDPLRDEGDAYAEALARAGVPVEHRCYDSLIHGFLAFAGAVRATEPALDQITSALGRAFTQTSKIATSASG